MTAIPETVDVDILGMKTIGLAIITATEGTLGIRLLRGRGRENVIRIVAGMTTLIVTENSTKTDGTTIEIGRAKVTTETMPDPRLEMIGKTNPHDHRLLTNDIPKMLKSNHLQAQEQIATKSPSTKSLTTQANQIVKSFSGV